MGKKITQLPEWFLKKSDKSKDNYCKDPKNANGDIAKLWLGQKGQKGNHSPYKLSPIKEEIGSSNKYSFKHTLWNWLDLQDQDLEDGTNKSSEFIEEFLRKNGSSLKPHEIVKISEVDSFNNPSLHEAICHCENTPIEILNESYNYVKSQYPPDWKIESLEKRLYKFKTSKNKIQEKALLDIGISLEGADFKLIKGNLDKSVAVLANGDVLVEETYAEEYAKSKWLNLLETDEEFRGETESLSDLKGLSTPLNKNDLKRLASELYENRDNGFIFGFEVTRIEDKNGNDSGLFLIHAEGDRSIEPKGGN